MSKYTPELKNELANSISHGIGLLFGLVAIPILMSMAVAKGNPGAIVGAGIYGFSFILVFASSTLYHSIPQPKIKHVLRIIDHIGIYFLIAGTYTPFILAYLYNPTGITILSLLWSLTLFGIFYKVFFINGSDKVSLMIYIGMGWLIMVAPNMVIENIPSTILLLIAIGGVLYTLGVFFYSYEKIPYNHAIWHLFVLAASVCHYVAVMLSLLQNAN